MKIDVVERQLFFEGVFLKYGFDFRQYAQESLDRRLEQLVIKFQKKSALELLQFCLSSKEAFREVLPGLTINVSEFFRDPGFFRALQDVVYPVLATYAAPTVWIAGCSSGEELISLCIGLDEADILHRTKIYATDINPVVLAKARSAIYDVSIIPEFNKGYVSSGGRESPSVYYSSDYDLVQFDRRLLRNVTFLDHNLATDDVFVEAQLILCRNVLIYFNPELQDRVVHLFSRSLSFKGLLGIGPRESLRFSKAGQLFDPLVREQNLYVQKVNHLATGLRGED